MSVPGGGVSGWDGRFTGSGARRSSVSVSVRRGAVSLSGRARPLRRLMGTCDGGEKIQH
jgi:hypothetical protein